MGLSSEAIVAYAREKGFRPQTIERWLKFPDRDREALWAVVCELKMGENHLRDFMDWLEEISLRDGAGFSEVLRGESLSRVLSDPRLGRNDKLRRAKEEIRRLRFPRLARIEEAIQEKIRGLKLGSEIKVNVPPGLEGGTLLLQVTARSYEGLKGSVDRLSELAKTEAMREVFSLLEGRTENKRETCPSTGSGHLERQSKR